MDCRLVICRLLVGAVLGMVGPSAQPPSDGGPVRLGTAEDARPPERIKYVAPERPISAADEEAVVVLDLKLHEDGTVDAVKVLSGKRLFINPAVAAARQWEYRPTVVNGKRRKVVFTVEVEFRLPKIDSVAW